jgi:hypothetical protein
LTIAADFDLTILHHDENIIVRFHIRRDIVAGINRMLEKMFDGQFQRSDTDKVDQKDYSHWATEFILKLAHTTRGTAKIEHWTSSTSDSSGTYTRMRRPNSSYLRFRLQDLFQEIKQAAKS